MSQSLYDINQSSERGKLGVYPYKYDFFAPDYYIYQPALILNSSDLDFVIEMNQNTPLDLFVANSVPNMDSAEDLANLNSIFQSVYESSDNVNLITNTNYYTCENISLKLNPENSNLDSKITSTSFKSLLQSILEARSKVIYNSQAYFNTSQIISEITDSLCSQSVNNLVTSYLKEDGTNDLVDFWNYSHKNWTTSKFFHKGDSLVMLYDINLNYETKNSAYTAINNVDFSVNIFFAIRYYLNNTFLDDSQYNDITTLTNIPFVPEPIETIQITNSIKLGDDSGVTTEEDYNVGRSLLELNDLKTTEINIGGGVDANDLNLTGEYKGSGEYAVNTLQINELRIT